MLIEIRQSDVRASGSFSRKPITVTADTITIGRGSDQLVQINCRQLGLAHCSIVRHSDGQFEVNSSAAMSVNKHSCRNQLLKSGDIIRIAGAEISISIPESEPQTGDIAVSLTVKHFEESNIQTRSTVKATHLDQTLLRRRPLAWLLFLSILCGALILPYVKSFGLPQSLVSATPAAVQPALQSWTKALKDSDWGPSHAIWNSGTLADAHQHFASECSSCHVQPFEKTSVAACMECHENTGVHSVKPEAGFQVADDAVCGTCHADHNGGGLTRGSQQKCVDCHSDINASSLGMSELPNIVDFGDSHPEFSLPIHRHNGEQWDVTRRPLGVAATTEKSGLRFSHQFHLEKAAQQANGSAEALVCADCHSPDNQGGFNDIVMEDQCQSCHSLAFDTDVPEFQAPHQQIADVVASIDAWYQRKQRNGEPLNSGPRSMRPGQSATASSSLDAKQHALKVASSLIERESCVQCHQIQQRSAPLAERKIAPTFIQSNWLKIGSFDHTQHRTQDCSDCHAAEESSQSADVLIPSIDVCQTCHVGEHSNAVLENDQRRNNCIDCHVFHQAPRVMIDTPSEAP